MDDRLSQLIEALSDDETRDAGLADLTDEQLAATRDELVALFQSIRSGEVEEHPADDVETLRSIHDAVGYLRAAGEARETAAAERAEEIANLEAGMEPTDEVVEPEPEPVEAAAEAAAEAAVEPESEPESEPVEPPAKPRQHLAALASKVPAAAKPRPGDLVVKPRWQTLDGKPITNGMEIAERIVAAVDSFSGSDLPVGANQKVSVVKLRTELPETHHLANPTAIESNMRVLGDVTAPAANPEAWTDEQRAIVASGGWCAPAEPRYDIPDIVTAARPFRDGLARVTSGRGTINYVRAARLSTILANTTGAAVTTWENTTDETPGESTKTRQTHACRTIQEEELGAVVARMRFGNFQQRAFPEDVAHDLGLVAARHARVAEVRLLDALIADMAVDVAQTGVLGTARDVKHHFAQTVSELGYTERSGQMVRAVISNVLIDMIYSDVAMQQASGSVDALLVGEAFSRQLLASIRGLVTTEVRDVPTGADAFVTNSDGENLADWPDDFEVPFFFDGTAVFADGGSLDIGIVRDSTLNDTNDYEIFYETFEGLLWLGPYGKTLTLTTCPNGESQVASDETGSLCSGS